MTTILVALGAAFVGLLIGWLAARVSTAPELNRAEAALAAERAASAARQEDGARHTRDLERAVAAREQAVAGLQRQVTDLREEQGRLLARVEAERQLAAEKLALLREAEAKLREAFATLSADALRSNSQSFLELARTSLGEYHQAAATTLQARERAVADLVKPLQESLQKVDATLQHVERERVGAYATLTEQIRSVALGQQGLQVETANLVKALREPKARGRWGEIQLRRVVELAGMLDHCDFCEQQSMPTDESRLIPDLVVQLPGQRQVIVDAKVPLTAYLEAIEAADDATRDARLRDHARQVRQHVTKLAGKAYWDQIQPAPEFVVMFLPGEPFFSAALLHDPTLVEWGVEKRVILASPITLIALLRAVAYGWRQERIAENAQEISDLGRELYERLRVVAEHWGRVGGALDKAVDAYNLTVASLETRLFAGARRLKELGAGTDKDLPALDTLDRHARPIARPELNGQDVEAI
jgi:DNA recombination protein RmuC